MNPELYDRLAAANSFQSSSQGKKRNQNFDTGGQSIVFANTGTRHERSAAQSPHVQAGPPPTSSNNKNNKKKVIIHSVDEDHSSTHDQHTYHGHHRDEHEYHAVESNHDDHYSHHHSSYDHQGNHHYGTNTYYDTGDDAAQDQYYDNDYVENQYGQQTHDDYQHESAYDDYHQDQHSHNTARKSGGGRGRQNKVAVVTEDLDE
jgi:hypothetical protein